jgi:Uma2 family endonuclease
MGVAMPVATKLGPADHDRPLSLEEFEAAEFEDGFKYELIAGRLCVSPQANFAQHWLERWLVRQLDNFSDEHPEVLAFVATKGRVYLPEGTEATVPEPDFALYRDLPAGNVEDINWQLLSPFIVGEILTADDGAEKDLVRNPALFIQVPTVQEYWVLDGMYLDCPRS